MKVTSISKHSHKNTSLKISVYYSYLKYREDKISETLGGCTYKL